MYSVSNAYLTKLLDDSSKRRRIIGYVDNIPFTEDDILEHSFSFNVKCESGNDITLGGVNVGKLSLTFLKSFSSQINRNTWKGRRISISMGLYLGLDANDEEIWEDVPIRPFFIDSADHSLIGIDITAYDAMQKFDKPCTLDSTEGKIYDLLSLACTACGVELGMTRAQTEALPNGTELFALYPDSDIETWRDFVYWTAVCACGFCDIDRTGKLIIRTWSNTSVLSVDKWNRGDKDKWSDFATKFTGISVVNLDKKTTSYYGMETDDGATMNIGSNPFLQYGTDETKTRQRRAILNGLVNLQYVPFKSTSLIDPAIDLGDVITYVGGIANNSVCCCMGITISYVKNVLQGYGKDPALANAKSKTDKNLAGLLASTSENEIVTHVFQNAEIIELEEDVETEIIHIRFATISPRVIKAFHEICMDVEASGNDPVEAEVHYYLNSDLIASYKPVETWGEDGDHILSLMKALNTLEGGQRYDWQVKIVMHNGSATIARSYANAILEGQGLVAVESWDGLIEIEDASYSLALHGWLNFDYEEDDVDVDHIDVIGVNITDNYSLVLHGAMVFDYEEDDLSVITRQGVYRRITEDGEIRTTEDGKIRMTEGDG